jgi:hypothetical protein
LGSGFGIKGRKWGLGVGHGGSASNGVALILGGGGAIAVDRRGR